MLAACIVLLSMRSIAQSPKVEVAEPLVHAQFVGCAADGQVGPVPAPNAPEKPVLIRASMAKKLTYYKSSVSLGVLAPQGWYCFATYGSSGSYLFVAPKPIRDFPGDKFDGSIVELQNVDGETSGRFTVAQVVARVFPAHRQFVQNVIEMFDFFADKVTYSPFPDDRLTYRNNRVVEYKTGAYAQGLGTMSWLAPNGRSIMGVAILKDGPPHLLLLSARLPDGLDSLTPEIVKVVEADSAAPRPHTGQ